MFKRPHTKLRSKPSLWLLAFCLICIYLFNFSIRTLLVFRRQLHLKRNELILFRTAFKPATPVALVTMADPMFQNCAIQLLRAARQANWQEPIYLLAIEYDRFERDAQEELEQLGVFIIKTRPILDRWLSKEMSSTRNYRVLQRNKFRKMEMFFNPVFRTFERLIFLDADGLLKHLQPMTKVIFPSYATILLRQNDRSFKKGSLYYNEIAAEFLSLKQRKLLMDQYPDREKSGATSYFIVDVKKLPSPREIFLSTIKIMCDFRSAFKLNDQTLLNLLFYKEMAMFPHCSWDEVIVMESSEELKKYCVQNMRLQRRLFNDYSLAYRHMAPSEKSNCLRPQNHRQRRERESGVVVTEHERMIEPVTMEDIEIGILEMLQACENVGNMAGSNGMYNDSNSIPYGG